MGAKTTHRSSYSTTTRNNRPTLHIPGIRTNKAPPPTSSQFNLATSCSSTYEVVAEHPTSKHPFRKTPIATAGSHHMPSQQALYYVPRNILRGSAPDYSIALDRPPQLLELLVSKRHSSPRLLCVYLLSTPSDVILSRFARLARSFISSSIIMRGSSGLE